MQTDCERSEWTQAWASWAKEQSRQLDWQHGIEMRRRILVRAATNGDIRLRDALFTLVTVAHSVGEEMRKRQADASELCDRDIEALASNIITVMSAVPSPMRRCDDDLPF
jgi:hypothetical protein